MSHEQTLTRTLQLRRVPNVTFLSFMRQVTERFGTNYRLKYMKPFGSFVNAEIELRRAL
jgi:hypothetical protein